MTDEREALAARLEMYANECGGGQLEADLLEAVRMLRALRTYAAPAAEGKP